MELRAEGQPLACRGWGLEMPHRLALPILLAVIAVLLIAAAEAHGGTYTVRQCHNSAPQNHLHEASAERLPNPGPYAVSAAANVCGKASEDFALKVSVTGTALHGQYGRLRFAAPPGTRIVGVKVDAKLRRDDGHKARLIMADAAGVPQVKFANGIGEATAFRTYLWSATGGKEGHEQLIATLICDKPGGNCPGEGNRAKTFIRDVVLTLSDDAVPTVALAGELVDGGWIRADSRLVIDADDKEGGLTRIIAVVNGVGFVTPPPLECALVAGTSDATRLAPCPSSQRSAQVVDTRSSPFADGANSLVACAFDFGERPNIGCAQSTIKVDNTAPELGFSPAQDPDDPELIRAPATDATSGLDPDSATISYRRVGEADWLALPTSLADGELRARVNSEAVAAGQYEFRAAVDDLAGNESVTTDRADGEPMRLRFPLKEPVELRAELGNGGDDQVVGYRKEGEVRGRLLDSAGRPIGGETVAFTQRFAPGSLIDTRSGKAVTNANGRYRALLPGGPSRDIDVTYGGSRRYSGDREAGLDFDVRGKAKLRVSKRRITAGNRVAFRGRVKHHFARIPRGGKLVEVQVKNGRSWTTLQEATGTDSRGAIVVIHRFRGFYTRPVTFVFRLKATRENGWPYRGAATSKRRRVTVLPR